MPQLDFSTFLPQLFWLLVSFIVLYALMKWLALPRVGAAIEARRARLDDDLGQAQALKAQAEAALAAYEKSLTEARAQAQATLRSTLARVGAEAAERQRQFAAALATETEAAEREIAAARARALSEIRGVAVDVARSVTEKLVGPLADERALSEAVGRTMAERPG
jgi:F-type H+-transporting ATPase subunit b